MFQGFFKGVSRVFMVVSRVFNGCFKGLLWLNQGCFKECIGVSKCVPMGYKSILTICPVYFIAILLVLQGHFKGATRMLHF